MSVKSQQYEDTVLIKPKSKFWPLERYIEQFGDPKGARLKKLGHKITRIQGYQGVLVPGDDGTGPWDLETRTGTRLEKDEEESVGSSGGEQDVAETKFASMRKAMRGSLAAAAVGAMNDILASCSAPPEERAKEMENRKRRKMQAKKKRKAQGEVEKKRQYSRAFIDLDVDSMDSDSDGEDVVVGLHKRQAKRISLGNDAKAAKAPSGPSPSKAEAVGDVVPHKGEEENVSKNSKGAPSKDSLLVEARLWSDFSVAAEGSAFFSKVLAREIAQKFALCFRCARALQISEPCFTFPRRRDCRFK